MTRALIGLDGPFDPATEAFMGDGSVRIEAFTLRSRMLHILRTEEPSPVVRASLETTAEAGSGVICLESYHFVGMEMKSYHPGAPGPRRRVAHAPKRTPSACRSASGDRPGS